MVERSPRQAEADEPVRDGEARKPVWIAIQDYIVDLINGPDYSPGDKVPSDLRPFSALRLWVHRSAEEAERHATTEVELHRRNSASFRLHIQTCAVVVVEGATVIPLHMEPPPCSSLDSS